MNTRMLIRSKQLNEAIKNCHEYHGATSTNEAIFSIGANFTGFDHFIDFCESLVTSYRNSKTDEDLLEFIQARYDEEHILVTYELCLMILDENDKRLGNQQICGILYKHNDDTYSLWQGNLTNDETRAIQEILNNHETDGYSIRGKYDEIIK